MSDTAYYIARAVGASSAMRQGPDGVWRNVPAGGEDVEFGRLGPIDPPPAGSAFSHSAWVIRLAVEATEVDPDHHRYFMVAVTLGWVQPPLF